MDSLRNEKIFIAIALGGIAAILIVGIVLAVMENRRDSGAGKGITGKTVETDETVVSFNTVDMGNMAPEMVVISNWEDVEVSEVVTEDTEEKKTMNLRLQDVNGMTPDANTGYIFVGDSRFVNMNDVCEISKKDNLFMVAKVGEGYSWFSQTALKQIKRIISTGLYDKWKLVICLGINDLGSINNYVKKYEELENDYDITLVSVNPVNNYGTISNTEIEKFNSSLKKLDLPYINTYNILMTTGYSTTDGLHYSGDTTRKIYDGILLGLEEINPGTLTTESSTILDKNGQSKKKSIQSEILAENKYVKKSTAAQAVPAAGSVSSAPAPQVQAPAAQTPAQGTDISPEEMERILREIEEYERSQQGGQEEAPPEEAPSEEAPPEEAPPEEAPPEEEGDG